MQMADLDVSVYVITYFHEQYIEQALESVLSQKTHYKYEIVVSDDGSTDRTMEILRKYEKKYPNIIRVYHNEENLGIAKNIYLARCYCRGRYIIPLAGDDYWINNYKIEKQVSFLEAHKEYIAVGNVIELRYDNDLKAFDVLPKPKERNKVFSMKNYEKGETFYAHGFVMRNLFLTRKGRKYFGQARKISDKVDDAIDIVLLLKIGKIFIMNIVTNVYRVPRSNANQNNYNSKFSREEKFKNSVDNYNNLYKAFGKEVNLKNKFVNCFSVGFVIALVSRNFKSFIKTYNTIPIEYRSPFYKGVFVKCLPGSLRFCIKRLYNEIKKRGKRYAGN